MYKVIRFICLYLKISLTTELIEFSSFNLGYCMVLGYFSGFYTNLTTELLGARGAATSILQSSSNSF